MKRLVLFTIVAASLPVAAQAQATEEIVVSAMRAPGYGGMPAVTISKPADFLVQEIRLVNDSRAPDLRKKEIIATISSMLKAAAADKRIALSYGDGFLEPVNLNDDSLQIIEDKKRADTSTIDIYVKTSLASGDNAKERIAGLRSFIQRAQLAGRTEIEPLGDIGLSIVNPERFRYDILAKIAAENARMASAMGGRCRVELGGLEERVQWQRTDIAELTLFIPYTAAVTDCAYPP